MKTGRQTIVLDRNVDIEKIEVSEIFHVNLRAGWKKLTKPIDRLISSLAQVIDSHLFNGRKVLKNCSST